MRLISLYIFYSLRANSLNNIIVSTVYNSGDQPFFTEGHKKLKNSRRVKNLNFFFELNVKFYFRPILI